ncbi:DUF4232 domain-containing protein [Streptomyces sp. NPDC002476]|uniref:DUF4232 domain-containing protein n=1 Tax=Streptomyces sp. NPDC002476 TaxID=3364648 RepID=UPI00367C3AC8
MRSNRFRTTGLAATALLAALSLTACTGDDDAAAEKAGAAAPVASTSDQRSSTTGTDTGKTADDNAKDAGSKANAPAENAAGTSKGSGSGTSNAGTSNGNKGNTNSSPVTCTGDNTKVTVSKVSRPINHLLLTATNTGNRPCYAYHAPALRFDDSQAAFPVLRDSMPQAVVTLEPGQSAYASIGLSGEDDMNDLHKGTRLAVYFMPKSNSGSTGSPANLKLPADTYWGNNGFVTYWQTEMDDALTF